MNSLVECVPNFSEGRNAATIDAIGASIRAVEGVKLLSVEPDGDYNRSVVTFVGEPEPVVNAAVAATGVAVRLINMRLHTGEHPRLGAVDVVPFIPIRGASLEDCVRLAEEYGKRVSRDFHIPIYLYEYAARSPMRRSLADIRKGEYENLAAKLNDPAWKPDFGDALFNPASGATVTGARKFLIAYNVNLNTPDSAIAQEIAFRIREIGRPRKDPSGAVVKNEEGETVRIPGSLKAVKAMGVFLQRFNIAQVSMNLVDFETTGMHTAFEEVHRQAAGLGAEATGSEIVGLTPLNAILASGRYYANTSGSGRRTEDELVATAVEHLGLSQLEPFNPAKKIIEYML
ncbi:MAG TPA: glutamate formimidoyltransferase [Bacteroidota bacterium]|nr:glutamate formimidoyltransferase [Bacteroidota bacterium]